MRFTSTWKVQLLVPTWWLLLTIATVSFNWTFIRILFSWSDQCRRTKQIVWSSRLLMGKFSSRENQVLCTDGWPQYPPHWQASIVSTFQEKKRRKNVLVFNLLESCTTLEIVACRDIEILENPTTKSFCPTQTGHSVAEAWSETGKRNYLKGGSDFPQGTPLSSERRYLIRRSP